MTAILNENIRIVDVDMTPFYLLGHSDGMTLEEAAEEAKRQDEEAAEKLRATAEAVLFNEDA